jgi:ATP-dependent DNA helicase RecG
MTLPVNIDDLINHRKVEWARIEYKEGWNPEKVLHTLCAFANVMREIGSPPPVFSSPENRD